jgi:hypothetical protein
MGLCVESKLVSQSGEQVRYTVFPCGNEAMFETLVIDVNDYEKSYTLGSKTLSHLSAAVAVKIIRSFAASGSWPPTMGHYS